MITYSSTSLGAYQAEGQCTSTHGRFYWQRQDGTWDGGWAVEPLEDLLARMGHSGPYKYPAYQIVEAEPPQIVIKPTCFGCGMIAGISCGTVTFWTPELRSFLLRKADPLVDFNEDHQFSIQYPVREKIRGKFTGKRKLQKVWFNSTACANLCLLELTRTESRGVVHYDHAHAQTLGEYRADQGWKRCPVCRTLHKGAEPCCGTQCKDAYVDTVEYLVSLKPLAEEKLSRRSLAYRQARMKERTTSIAI